MLQLIQIRQTLLLILLLTGFVVKSQDLEISADSTNAPVVVDSTDTNSFPTQDSVKNNAAKFDSGVKTTVEYQAEDSIIFDLNTNDVYLFGKTSIEYGNIKLTAAQTKINWLTRTMEADYVEDSTGKKIDKPVFTEKGESYEASRMTYNFGTRKAYINGIITKQGEAFMQGDRVKKSGDELYIRDAKYTTCNLENPHFHIASKKLKVIPGNKVISGPFNLSFREIKSPIGFFFGMFPQPDKDVSGVIVPSYGEQRTQGFFLRDGGYYFKFNDYIDARITGDIYTSGAYGIRVASTYKKRYAYSGNLNFNYNVLRRFSVREDDGESTGFSFNWNHKPQNYGTSRFSSSVNIQTNNNNLTSNIGVVNIQRSIQSSFASNVSYSKTFRNTPFSLSATLRHRQSVQNRTVDLSLPEFTFTTKRQFPFKKIKALEKGILGKLGFSHNFRARNDISNKPKATIPGINQLNRTALEDSLIEFRTSNLSLLFDRASIGGIHTIPISTSFNLFKFFTVSPSATYNEVWYPKELQFEQDTAQNGFNVFEKSKFSRAGWYNLSASMNTRLYGFVYFKKGKIKAIRHVMNPSLSYSYNPDFSRKRVGRRIFQEFIDENGDPFLLSRYAGFPNGGPPIDQRQRQTLSFGISNNVEMKVFSKKDTVTGFKKISLFDNLSISSGYDLEADSFNLNNINIRMATSLFNKKLRLSTNGTLNPYRYVLEGDEFNSRGERNSGRRIDQLRWFSGEGIGQMQRLSLTLSTRFSAPSSKKKDNGVDNFDKPEEPIDEELAFIQDNPDLYIDFKIPWNVSLNYNISYSKIGLADGSINTNSATVNGDFSLTPKTKVTFRTGYNFNQKLIQPTNIGVVRDLHCWSLSFNVVPFGFQQSFNLRINARSSVLQDLKLDKRRSWVDN